MKKRNPYLAPAMTAIDEAPLKVLCGSDGVAGEFEENEFTEL